MNEMQVFQNPDFGEIRTLHIEGEPWFIAADVCRALGHTNITVAMDRIDPEDKAKLNLGLPGGDTNCINESGLYSLIMGSRKPEAKKFKRWVTREVLPTIRKTGSYQVKPMTQAEIVAAQAQLMVEYEKRLDAVEGKAGKTESKLTAALNALAALTPESWREEMNRIIDGICQEKELSYVQFRGQLYDELERVAGCDLYMRQCRLRNRMKQGGATYREREAVSKIDIIERDPKLKAIFEGIVRRQQALYAKSA